MIPSYYIPFVLSLKPCLNLNTIISLFDQCLDFIKLTLLKYSHSFKHIKKFSNK